jgi:hypothetical protein
LWKKPTHKPYTFAIRTNQRYTKNCKRVCLANAKNQAELKKASLQQPIPHDAKLCCGSSRQVPNEAPVAFPAFRMTKAAVKKFTSFVLNCQSFQLFLVNQTTSR